MSKENLKILTDGNPVKHLFSWKTKFPQGFLLLFLFLINEIESVASFSVTVGAGGGANQVPNAFDKHQASALTDAHFRTTGNSTKDEDPNCIPKGDEGGVCKNKCTKRGSSCSSGEDTCCSYGNYTGYCKSGTC